ncbi:hypothetical protein PENSPDRAFT_738982 [Peniophora sp. CONT]|nr:hypothetical protein PENSPDRAFT_738982 [Peniophora sp. CONT]
MATISDMDESITRGDSARNAWSTFIASRFPADAASGSASHASELQVELELLSEYAARAKQSYNARVQACRLPAELLGTVFMLLRDIWPPTASRSYAVLPQESVTDSEGESDEEEDETACGELVWSYSTGWMSVTSVCSIWRKVAISHPTLWCEIHCASMHPEAGAVILARSAPLPVCITLDFGDKSGSSLAWTRKYMRDKNIYKRIRRLVMRNIPRDTFITLMTTLQDMPLLEELSFSIRHWHGYQHQSIEYVPEYVEDGLATPNNLSRVTFKGCLLSLTSPFLSRSITHLTLMSGFSSNSDGVLPNANAMLNLISSLTNLQELRLQGIPAYRSSEDAHVLSDSVCHLPPCFRLLELFVYWYNGSDATAVDFLSRIVLPLGSHFRMEVSQDGDVLPQGPLFARIVCAARKAYGYEGLPWSLNLDFWSVRMTINDIPDLEEESGQSSIFIKRVGGDSKGNVAEHIVKQLSLADLTTIRFSPTSVRALFVKDSPYNIQLHDACSIRNLVLWLPTDLHLIGLLGHALVDGVVTPLFPRMQSIALQQYFKGSSGGSNVDNAVSALAAALTARRKIGFPVRKLFIDKRYKREVALSLFANMSIEFIDVENDQDNMSLYMTAELLSSDD